MAGMEGGLSADRRAHSKITRPHPTIPTRNIPGRLSLDAPTHHPQSQLPPTGSYLCPSAAHAPRRRPPGLFGSASTSTPAWSRSSPHATLARPHAPARGALHSRPMQLGRAAPMPPPVLLGRARSSPPIACIVWFGEPVHPNVEPLLASGDACPPPFLSPVIVQVNYGTQPSNAATVIAKFFLVRKTSGWPVLKNGFSGIPGEQIPGY